MVPFYVDGYRTGDPFVSEPHPSVHNRPNGLPETADVLIVGCGPAGLVLAAQMAAFGLAGLTAGGCRRRTYVNRARLAEEGR